MTMIRTRIEFASSPTLNEQVMNLVKQRDGLGQFDLKEATKHMGYRIDWMVKGEHGEEKQPSFMISPFHVDGRGNVKCDVIAPMGDTVTLKVTAVDKDGVESPAEYMLFKSQPVPAPAGTIRLAGARVEQESPAAAAPAFAELTVRGKKLERQDAESGSQVSEADRTTICEDEGTRRGAVAAVSG